MFCGPETRPTARKPHRCTSCGETIETGETYVKWASFDDGSAFTNKMHPECLKAHDDDAKIYGEGTWEYSPYSHERGSAE
jgi:predicted RNA-binding Zn-ribbon protein involved in translation (DUF1610 family)